MDREVPRSVADDFEQLMRRAREARRPRVPRGDLDRDVLEQHLRELQGELYVARTRAHMTQDAVAASMDTTTSAVSRLETSFAHAPSTATLLRFASAVGCDLQIRLVQRERETGSTGSEGGVDNAILRA